MTTLRDVFEYAFVDCPAKQKYMDALLPLNPSGESSARRVPIPERYKKDQVAEEAPKEEVPAEPVEIVEEAPAEPVPEPVEVTVEYTE
jgi:Lon-like ATP-dependent protease